jgi:hypothetical protein
MTNQEIDDIFAHLDELQKFDLDAFAAFMHRRHGVEACREFMKLRAEGLQHREYFEDCADDLEDKGLDHVSEIIRQIAATMPWGLDCNPYHPTDRVNWLGHRASWFNGRRMWRCYKNDRRPTPPRHSYEPVPKDPATDPTNRPRAN